MITNFVQKEIQMKKSELIKAVAAAANVSPDVAKNSVNVIAPAIDGIANAPEIVDLVAQIKFVNDYLAAGDGRGRLQSQACVYDGQAGYFFLGKVWVNGVEKEAISFSTIYDQIVLTANLVPPPNVGVADKEAS